LHSGVCQNGTTHFRQLDEQHFFGVDVLGSAEKVQYALDNRGEKTQWDAYKIIDISHGLDAHQSHSHVKSVLGLETYICLRKMSSGFSSDMRIDPATMMSFGRYMFSNNSLF